MKTVLVAEDEFDLGRTLKAILEGEGYCVEAFGNGRDLLERTKRSRPDLLLVDVMMPCVGGLDVLEQVRRTKELVDLPVVVMSAVSPRSMKAVGRWDRFLRKPFTIETLLGTVTELIGKPTAERG